MVMLKFSLPLFCKMQSTTKIVSEEKLLPAKLILKSKIKRTQLFISQKLSRQLFLKRLARDKTTRNS
jgi:hypothetical protein